MNTPKSILSLDDFQALTKQGKYDVQSRLQIIQRIAESLSNGSMFLDYPDFNDFIDNLELDLSLAQEYGVHGQSTLSRWQTHHSWGLKPIQNTLNDKANPVAKTIRRESPKLHSTKNEYRQWFVDTSKEILLILKKMDEEISEEQALSMLLCIDYLMSITLSTCYRAIIANAHHQ